MSDNKEQEKKKYKKGSSIDENNIRVKKFTSNIDSVPLLYISSPGGCLRSHFLCVNRKPMLVQGAESGAYAFSI